MKTGNRHAAAESRAFAGGRDHFRRRRFTGRQRRGQRIAARQRRGDRERRGGTPRRIGIEAAQDRALDRRIEVADDRRRRRASVATRAALDELGDASSR